jgi:hypothetical protein
MLRFHPRVQRALATVWLSFVLSAPAFGQTHAAPPPPGHTRSVVAHRASVTPVIDGVVSDQEWKEGSIADRFWVSQWKKAPSGETRVVVLYDDHALYFAFTCLDDRPDLIRASQITRDGSPGIDDRVTVELDPYHNHRSLSSFTVTARGTQSDAMAGGRARKIEWKGEWRAAAQRTPFGWTAEMAIPFDILDFDAETHTFGINFSRYQSRTKESSEWADLTPQRLPEEAGHLTALRLPAAGTGGRLTVMQYASGSMGRAHADGDTPGGAGTGADVRYEWPGSLTSVASVRPDFSDTDADIAGIGFSYTEKFVRDRRPFFQEGSGFFADESLFHSGRVENFDVGVKTFGRVADYQVGVLATSGVARSDYVSRIVREIGPAFNLSATLVGTNQSALDNNTLQLQAGGRLGRHLQVDGDVARSSTYGQRGDGLRGHGSLGYHSAHWYSGVWMDHTDPGYLPANGFIAADVIGTTGQGLYGGYNRGFGDGWLRYADASVTYDSRDTVRGLRQRETTSLYAGAKTSLNVQLNAGMTVGSYRPRGSAPGEWTDTFNDDRYYQASAYYNSPGGQFGYGALYAWGFLGFQDYESVAPSLWVAPNPHLSLSYSFERATHYDAQQQHVLSGTWEIDGGQALSARWFEYDGGYYRVSYRRTMGRGVDAYGVYTTDPYDPGRFSVKLVWTFLPFARR